MLMCKFSQSKPLCGICCDTKKTNSCVVGRYTPLTGSDGWNTTNLPSRKVLLRLALRWRRCDEKRNESIVDGYYTGNGLIATCSNLVCGVRLLTTTHACNDIPQWCTQSQCSLDLWRWRSCPLLEVSLTRGKVRFSTTRRRPSGVWFVNYR